jgi:hypothetical protein
MYLKINVSANKVIFFVDNTQTYLNLLIVHTPY